MDEYLFLADAMLGKLSRWIRICGFDTCYTDSTMRDSDILVKITKSGRILITRDRELSLRSDHSLLIKSHRSDEQLLEFLRKYPPQPSKFFTRCTVCNGILDPVDPPYCGLTVPKSVAHRGLKVNVCRNCHKIYWNGTHRKSIEIKLRSIMEIISNENH
ncbi:hypothetical protein OXIME_001401 [Oxyplasma meridianum]|uniref:Mut7-C RNAse domain-containing protein n=1 Tax=Oxyplasma meridianum TaxID=3073602 RepID=A0AAX4NJ15_9ARCH